MGDDNGFISRMIFIFVVVLLILSLFVLYNKLFRSHTNYLSNGLDVMIIDSTMYRGGTNPVYIVTQGNYTFQMISANGTVIKGYSGYDQGAFNLDLPSDFPTGVYSIRYQSSLGTNYNLAVKVVDKDFLSGIWDWFSDMSAKSKAYLFDKSNNSSAGG